MTTRKTQKTIYMEQAIDSEQASALYHILKTNVQWTDGIKTRHGTSTRKAAQFNMAECPAVIEHALCLALSKLPKGSDRYEILGVYLNNYENGLMYTPMHKHADTIQLVISLGATRTLKVGTKEYPMKNGDVVVFGSSIHGVPQEPSVTEGRISIATFMVRV